MFSVSNKVVSLMSLLQAIPLFHRFLLLFMSLSPPLTFFGCPSFIHTWLSCFPHSVVNVIWASISSHRLQYISEHNHVHMFSTLNHSCSISLVHVVWTPIKRLNHSFCTCRLSKHCPVLSKLWTQNRFTCMYKTNAKMLSSLTKQSLKCSLEKTCLH